MFKQILFVMLALNVVSQIFAQQYGSFTDPRDGRVYKTVKIGNQEWMAENLNATKFNNGVPIPKSMWAWYENSKANGDLYGGLYTWYALRDKRNIAPKGWHVPSPKEWETLLKFIGCKGNCDDKLKKYGWLPKAGGYQNVMENFLGKRLEGRWWIGEEDNNEEDTVTILIFQGGEGGYDYSDYSKQNKYSIRCIRD
jgi:uncharacterized protein (TIGR02145 family)